MLELVCHFLYPNHAAPSVSESLLGSALQNKEPPKQHCKRGVFMIFPSNWRVLLWGAELELTCALPNVWQHALRGRGSYQEAMHDQKSGAETWLASNSKKPADTLSKYLATQFIR